MCPGGESKSKLKGGRAKAKGKMARIGGRWGVPEGSKSDKGEGKGMMDRMVEYLA